jgi:hypothetical protein
MAKMAKINKVWEYFYTGFSSPPHSTKTETKIKLKANFHFIHTNILTKKIVLLYHRSPITKT